MNDKVLVATISGTVSVVLAVIAALVTLASKNTELSKSAQGANTAQKEAESATSELRARIDELKAGALPGTPTYDSGWIELPPNCTTKEIVLKKATLPKLITGYFRLKTTGEIFPITTNQYGDGNQTNGVLLDIDPENKKLYVRLPCGSLEGNNIVHLGWYNGRNGTPGQAILSRTDVLLKLMVWQ